MKHFHRLLPTLLILSTPAFASDVNAQTPAPWTTSRIHGTPTPPPEFRISRVFARHSFDHPTSLLEIPSTGEILVTQIDGSILTISKSDDATDQHEVADLAEIAGGDVRLLSATLHPNFSSNGELFVTLVHPQGGNHTRVSRFNTNRNSAGNLMLNSDSEQVIIRWKSGGHNGGCLQFGPDGLLYISTGDGAGPYPPDGLTTGQDVTDLLGAMLRIDVDRTSGDSNYAIPAGNPFVGSDTARPEIFAYGLRNPWKFGIDPETGDVFAADNGWETWEMVHHIRAGQNCGWPVMEGRALLRSEVAIGPTPIVPPARDHHHSEANSVIGGPVYRSQKLSKLDGFFIYGDYITGTIWGLKSNGNGYVSLDVVDTDLRIVHFTQGSKGELYVLDYDVTGGIYELLPNDEEDLSEQFPKLLSETGIFRSLTDLQPAFGVSEYDVMAPRWHDDAVARRWVAVPQSGIIGDQVQSNVSSPYPEGTVFVKHLSIPSNPPTPLETQILHYKSGSWNPYSYLWNDAGTDAELVSSLGANKSVLWPDVDGKVATRTWRASATNECRLCHNAGANFVLGFAANQLQKHVAGGANAATYDAVLRQTGVLQTTSTVNEAETLVDPHDLTQDLNDRARSYLHANCGMCHYKGSSATISFFLRRDLSFDEMNTSKGTGLGTFGMRNALLIAPGDPWRSVVLYRMSKLGYARMPYIGSQVVDSDGVALIAEWIRSLSDERSELTSPPLIANSAEAELLQGLADVKSSAHRNDAIQTLVSSTEGSLALAIRLHAGQLTTEDRLAAVHTVSDAGSDIRGLFDDFVPEADRKKTLGRTFDPQTVLTAEGSAGRGELIFFASDARCRACHDVKNAEKSVGPTLTDVSKKYPFRSELLQHIMRPSEKIDDTYATWVIVTSSGKVLTGLVQQQDGDSITLRTADGKTVTVPQDDIDEQQKSRTSLMPEGVLADFTAQEAADLLAFIQSLSPKQGIRP